MLSQRVGAEDAELAGAGPRSAVDALLAPLNQAASRRFLREARAKVWDNTIELNAARSLGAAAYAERLGDLEALSAARVAELVRPGQVLLRLAVYGFGVRLVSRGSRFLGGRFLGGRFLGGRFLGGRVLGGRFLGGRFLGGRFLGGRFLGGRFLGGQFLGGQFLGGQFVGGRRAGAWAVVLGTAAGSGGRGQGGTVRDGGTGLGGGTVRDGGTGLGGGTVRDGGTGLGGGTVRDGGTGLGGGTVRGGGTGRMPGGPRSFDPARVADLEFRAWVGYYRRDWAGVLGAAVGLVRAGFGMSWPRTLRGAWLVLRANQLWAPADNDPDGARRCMQRFYGLVRSAYGLPGDIAEAARLEVEWWRVHRETQHGSGPADALVDALDPAVRVPVSGPAQCGPACLRRTARTPWTLSDRWVAEGCLPDSPLLALEHAALVRCYAALLAVVHR